MSLDLELEVGPLPCLFRHVAVLRRLLKLWSLPGTTLEDSQSTISITQLPGLFTPPLS